MLLNRKVFCPYAFLHILAEKSGDAKTCCISLPDYDYVLLSTACKMGIEAVCEKAANGSFGGLFPLREEERMSKLLKVLLAEERNQVSGGFGRQISEWPKFCGTGI